jgi:hypothetical protein
MAQEDKGLIFRGLLLLTLIGVLVTFVLGFMLWRQPPTVVEAVQTPPESLVAMAAAPSCGGFPSGVSWWAVQQMADALPSEPGWEVRYNAAASLARRGSDAVPWALIREMLDENRQKRNYLTHSADGKAVYDEVAARANMITALHVLSAWHEKQEAAKKADDVPPELRDIYAQVERLTQSPFAELKTQAIKARSSFFSR